MQWSHYNDHNGDNIWVFDYYSDFSSTRVKFDAYSLFAENNRLSILRLDNFEITGNDVSAAEWIYIESFPDSDVIILLFHGPYITDTVHDPYFSAELTSTGTIKMYCYTDKLTGDENDFTESSSLSLNTLHYIGISYDSSTRTAYLTVNNALSQLNVSGQWPTDLGYSSFLFSFSITAANNAINRNTTFYVDEVITTKFVAYNLFIQHYNEKGCW